VGATVNALKPVQAHIITGDINAGYEMRWYVLFPRNAWASSYVAPVGTVNGDETYVFIYNPNNNTVYFTIDSTSGSAPFSVSARTVRRYQMPQDSGARFSSNGGEEFAAIATVGADPYSNQIRDWGYTLVPGTLLATRAVVGWGPGSIDLTENASPVWVCAVDDTSIQIDYDNNGVMDATIDVDAFESLQIFDPDNDQTGMNLYTLDGTVFAAAWGQDPALGISGSYNQFDLGTTVMPFQQPIFIEKKLSTAFGPIPDPIEVGSDLVYEVIAYASGNTDLHNVT